MTDGAVARHLDAVRELSRAGHALAPDAPNATVRNRAWWVDGEPTPSRDRLHRRLLEQARSEAADVVQGRRAIVLAGPPGAGKSTVLNDLLGEKRRAYLVIDADEFKRALLREALADGSYESWLVPDEVREREAAGERFFPLELASLVHEESAYLAQQLRVDAIADGDNVVVDSVLSWEPAAMDLGRSLESADYSVTVLDVEVPYELSESRIRARWESVYATALEGGDSLGGRWVPSEYARGVFDGPGGKSKPELVARKLAEDCPAVRQYRLMRTTLVDGQPHQELEVYRRRAAPGEPLKNVTAAPKAEQLKPPRRSIDYRVAPAPEPPRQSGSSPGMH